MGAPMTSQEIFFTEESNNLYVFVEYVIKSPFLFPEIVTSELEIKPSFAYARGEKYLGKAFDLNTKETIQVWRERPWGLWKIDSKEIQMSHKKVEDHFRYLLDKLEPRRVKIEEYLNSSKNEMKLVFSVYWRPADNWGSYEISSDTIQKASRLCHYIEFGLTNLR
jgi:Domain of unknown function (DUF4279)